MKTKKLLLTVLSLLMVFALSIFVACKPTPDNSSTPDSSTPESSLPDSSTPDSSTDEVELSHITYHSGLDADAYVKGEDLDLSGLTITVHYTDGSSSEVVYNADDFAVSYDSNVPGYSGEASVTIEYMEKTCEKTVVFGSKYQITEVGAISSYANYLSVIGAETPIFTDVSDSYKVGDDNAFSVRPTVSGINNFDDSQHADIKDITFVITIEKWNGEAYAEMADYSTDVEIDETNGKCTKIERVHFLDLPIGK